MLHDWSMSFVDMNGEPSLTIWLNGCNFRCEFCHNPEIAISSQTDVTFEILCKKIDGIKSIKNIVFSGGEPTFNENLNIILKIIDKYKHLKSFGIHTNGHQIFPIDNPFKLVILSLKPKSQFIVEGEDQIYCNKMLTAMEYYSSCDYKELRIVDLENPKEYEWGYLLDQMKKSGWNINTVKNTKE